MALMKHTRTGRPRWTSAEAMFETLFADWPALFRRPFVVVPEGLDTIRADEFMEDGTLVVRVEIAGIDPEKDVEMTLDGDVLHISAERREEEETKERDYTRRELRYGAFHRDVLVPGGTTEADVKASYKDGMLEVRVPMAVEAARRRLSTKIPVTKG